MIKEDEWRQARFGIRYKGFMLTGWPAGLCMLAVLLLVVFSVGAGIAYLPTPSQQPTLLEMRNSA